MAKVQNGEKYCGKFRFNALSRAHKHYRRQICDSQDSNVT